MSNIPTILNSLRIPVIGSPLFIISNPRLVIEQCKAGIVGAMPALNARPASQLDEWLAEITETLAAHNRANPERPAAPFAINQIVHKSNDRLEHDMALMVKYKVPVIITSLGARPDVNEAIHGYGGVVLHDVINNRFARKAIEKGADGLIAVAAGAGGHAGAQSPFALVQEIREWFDGPLLLAGAIANGNAILAAQAAGADLAYIGSAFIATKEAMHTTTTSRWSSTATHRRSCTPISSRTFTATTCVTAWCAVASIPTTSRSPTRRKWISAQAARARRPGRTSGAQARVWVQSKRCCPPRRWWNGSQRNTRRHASACSG